MFVGLRRRDAEVSSVSWQAILHKKCPNTEFFSGPDIPVFGPEKTPVLDTFYAV